MEQMEDSNLSRRNKHLNMQERIQIEMLYRNGKTGAQIARLLGRSVRTIRRELKRGRLTYRTGQYSAEERYNADRGQTMYEKRRHRKAPDAVDPDVAEFLFQQIVVKRFSPEVAAHLLKKAMPEKAICTKTIYNLIDRGALPGITNESLWEKRLRKKKYRKVRRTRKRAVAPGHSITDRPAEVETREEFGHWEMDLVHAGTGALLTLTERKTRMSRIRKLKNRTQAAVLCAINEIEKQMGSEAFRCTFKSITADNGSEFLDTASLENSFYGGKRTHIYYAHPYSAWERGSNENGNRFIRRFIPKGLRRLPGKQEMQEIERWLNNYPRRVLGFQTAEEQFTQETAA